MNPELRPEGAPACGDLYRWDLDKTYLRTSFRTVRELVRTAMERAERKQNVPGSAALLREIRTRPDGVRNHIHVISASPTFMRRVILDKFRLDGVDVDRLFLKPQVSNVLRGRFRALRAQVGYKLPILVRTRRSLAPERQEFCFGDDSEWDAFIYSLYSDLCLGRRPPGLPDLLRRAGAYPEEIEAILEASEHLPGGEGAAVQRIFINLEERKPVEAFRFFGSRVVPSRDSFQTALVLYQHGRLTPGGVIRVAAAMVERHGTALAQLADTFEDTLRRGLVAPSRLAPLKDALREDPPLRSRIDPERAVQTFLERATLEPGSGASETMGRGARDGDEPVRYGAWLEARGA